MNRTIKWLKDEDGGNALLRIRRVQKDAAIVEKEQPGGSFEAVDDREAMRAFERALLELVDAVEELVSKVPELRVPPAADQKAWLDAKAEKERS